MIGIGLRHPYYEEIAQARPDVGFLEVHAENFFCGGAPRHFLERAAAHSPISLHGVGLSLGSNQPVCKRHLAQFKQLIDDFDPILVSDHASWSATGNAHLGDLLPLPYTAESLDRLAQNVERTQEAFGRSIFVENPSTYVAFQADEMDEPAFLNALVRRTGCGLLLDVNNVYVQSVNHGFDPYAYISAIDAPAVGEVHLAGHTERSIDGARLLIDTHNAHVRPEVWDLFAHAVSVIGPRPTLIEWDQDFPPLDALVAEAHKAQAVMNGGRDATA